MNKELLEEQLSGLPLYVYAWIDPRELEFTPRVRKICQAECPRYNQTWACPPAVGEVEQCREKCLGHGACLLIGTVVETEDISDMETTLATRGDHEAVTEQVGALLKAQGITPYILSTEACAICERCAWLDGQPCRFPEKMHPCVESHGINLIPTLEKLGLEFYYGENVITWYSLLFIAE